LPFGLTKLKMKNYSLKFKSFESVRLFILDEQKEITQEYQKIYSQGKGEDSPGGFEFERTRKINKRVVSKIFQKI